MDFKVKMDCKLGDQEAFFEHRSALSAAILLYSAYNVSKEYLIGTGPELYAEQWIRSCVIFSDEKFDDLILIYFTKILQGIQNG